jgi:hypothetical protein
MQVMKKKIYMNCAGHKGGEGLLFSCSIAAAAAAAGPAFVSLAVF